MNYGRWERHTMMNPEEAASFRTRRDAEMRLLARKPKHELVAIYGSESGTGWNAGAYSKDELVSGILDLRGLGIGKLNETIHVLHHEPGGKWPACVFCQCQVQWITSAGTLQQCVLGPDHSQPAHQERAASEQIIRRPE